MSNNYMTSLIIFYKRLAKLNCWTLIHVVLDVIVPVRTVDC